MLSSKRGLDSGGWVYPCEELNITVLPPGPSADRPPTFSAATPEDQVTPRHNDFNGFPQKSPADTRPSALQARLVSLPIRRTETFFPSVRRGGAVYSPSRPEPHRGTTRRTNHVHVHRRIAGRRRQRDRPHRPVDRLEDGSG